MSIALKAQDFARDRWGRPLILIDGKKVPYQRPSSLGDCIDNRFNLELWQKRIVAQGLATDHAVYATAVALGIEDTKENKSAWNDVVKQAMSVRRSSSKAELGTALHKMTERVDRGEALDLPPVFAADIAAYRKAMELCGLSVYPGMIECRCVCDEVQAAGTFDRLLVDANGTVYIGDVKTGASADYPHGFAVQLSVYGHAELYDPGTDERTPLPEKLDRTKGVIIHLPAGEARCSIHWIDLTKGWEAAKVAHWVRQTWQKDKGLLTQLTTISAPAAPTAHQDQPASNPRTVQLQERIAKMTDAQRTVLRARWPKGISLKKGISAVEYDILIPLIVDVEATEEQIRTTPDEGRDASPDAVAVLRTKFEALTSQQQTWINGLTTEAKKAGGGLSIKLVPSLRRFEIGRALVALAAHNHMDRLAELVAAVIGDVPGSPGALLASMGADDAVKFALLVDALVIGEEGAAPRLQPVA